MMNHEQRLNLEISSIKAIINIKEVFERLYDYQEFDKLYKNETLRYFAQIIKQYLIAGKKPNAGDVLIRCNKEQKQIFADNIFKCEEFQDMNYFEMMLYENVESDLQNFIKLNYQQYKGKERIENFKEGIADILSVLNQGHKQKTNTELVESVVKEIGEIRDGKKTKYIKTGYQVLDNFIGGFVKGGITLIGARPSQGKTTFMLNLKERLNHQGCNCMIFTIEMKAEDLIYKDLSYKSKINSQDIENGTISSAEYQKIIEISEHFKRDNYCYIDESSQTAEKIILAVKQRSIKKPVDVIFIDYLGLIEMGMDKSKNEAVEKLMNKLRQFTKESNIATIILSQLNRQVEARQDKKPILADLRDSGSIEQDANQVLFLHRPYYYFPDAISSTDVYNNGQKVEYCNLLNVIIAKARQGKTGDCYLEYIPEIQTINNTVKEIGFPQIGSLNSKGVPF